MARKGLPAEQAAKQYPDADMTELGYVMLNAKLLNNWTGCSYSLDEVAEMDSLVFVVLNAMSQGMEPRKGKGESVPKD